MSGQAPSSGPSSLQETVHDPPMYATTILAETIAASGTPVTGEVLRDRTRLSNGQSPNWRMENDRYS